MSVAGPFLFIRNFYHTNILKLDSNLSHRLNYEAAALTTQPPWLDRYRKSLKSIKHNILFFMSIVMDRWIVFEYILKYVYLHIPLPNLTFDL